MAFQIESPSISLSTPLYRLFSVFLPLSAMVMVMVIPWPLEIPRNKMDATTHTAQVQNETISGVEAVPADWHLRRSDNTATFDLEHTLHDDLIGDHVFESRCHSSFLWQKKGFLDVWRCVMFARLCVCIHLCVYTCVCVYTSVCVYCICVCTKDVVFVDEGQILES